MKIRTLLFLASLALVSTLPARSQTTTANFDSPACSGNGVQIYQGINFSASPWDCEKPGIPGDTTEMISWYQNNKTGTFKFVSPAVLVSLTLGASNSGTGGTFTISTDAGESLTKTLAKNTIANVITNFSKPAAVITVGFTGGWSLELDNIVYSPSAVTTPPSVTNVSVSCTPAAISTAATSQCTSTVAGTGAFSSAVTWAATGGSVTSAGVFTGTVAGSAKVTATSVQTPAVSGSATIVVSAPPPPTLNVMLSLPAGCILSGSTLSCTIVGSSISIGVSTTTAGATVSAPTVTVTAPGSSTSTSHSVTLSWIPSTSTVGGYNIYRSGTSGAEVKPPLNLSLVSGNTYTDSTVVSGQSYFYVVTGVDTNGNESDYSNEVLASIPNP